MYHIHMIDINCDAKRKAPTDTEYRTPSILPTATAIIYNDNHISVQFLSVSISVYIQLLARKMKLVCESGVASIWSCDPNNDAYRKEENAQIVVNS